MTETANARPAIGQRVLFHLGKTGLQGFNRSLTDTYAATIAAVCLPEAGGPASAHVNLTVSDAYGYCFGFQNVPFVHPDEERPRGQWCGLAPAERKSPEIPYPSLYSFAELPPKVESPTYGLGLISEGVGFSNASRELSDFQKGRHPIHDHIERMNREPGGTPDPEEGVKRPVVTEAPPPGMPAAPPSGGGNAPVDAALAGGLSTNPLDHQHHPGIYEQPAPTIAMDEDLSPF